MYKALMLVGAVLLLAGCKPVPGERFWWDDQKKEQLPNTYMLPDWPAASPVPSDPEPYVPKQLPGDEIKRAQAEQKKKIEAGIPRVGVPDPNKDRVKVPVAKWEGDGGDGSVDYGAAGNGEKTPPIPAASGAVPPIPAAPAAEGGSAPAKDTGAAALPGGK